VDAEVAWLQHRAQLSATRASAIRIRGHPRACGATQLLMVAWLPGGRGTAGGRGGGGRHRAHGLDAQPRDGGIAQLPLLAVLQSMGGGMGEGELRGHEMSVAHG